MIPWERLDGVTSPDGGELSLHRRGDEFSIRIDGREVMNSRQHASEDALASLGCEHLAARTGARVLVGGLGMGFTLAAALEALTATAEVVVAEIVPAVVRWNRGPLHSISGAALDDARTRIVEDDVVDVLRTERGGFDAVLLDVDHSPDSFIVAANAWLYTGEGIAAIQSALRPGGVLGVWSASDDPAFTRRLRRAGFETQVRPVRARQPRGARHHIWLAARP